MTITISTLFAGARAPEAINKVSATTEGAGTWFSLWKIAGSPTAGANPPLFSAGSGYIPTRATTGAIGQANAAGGTELRAIGLDAATTVAGRLVVYDRLWACSGFGTVITTLQSVTTPGALTAGRLVDGVSDFSDVELWLEVYAAPGATGATWTVIALDGAGVSRTMTYTHPANAESIGQMMQVTPLAAAAAGFQRADSFQASVSSGTAGDIGLTLLRRIATIELPLINTGAFKGALDLGLPRVRDDAALALMLQCTTTTSGVIIGSLGLSQVTP